MDAVLGCKPEWMYSTRSHSKYGITNLEAAGYRTNKNIKDGGKYAGLSFEVALEKLVFEEWISDVMVVKDKKRYMIGPDIKYYHNKNKGRGDVTSWESTPGHAFHYGSQHDAHTLCYHDSKIRLDIIDHISEQTLAVREEIGIHPSEREWALPRSHERHLLNLPQEILVKIIAYTVIVKDDVGTLSPQTITSNICGCYQEAEYRIFHPDIINLYQGRGSCIKLVVGLRNRIFELGSQNLKKLEIQDEEGVYTRLQRVLRRVIDASCLRVCKLIYYLGSEMLYRQNDFTFDLTYFRKYLGPQRITASSLMLDKQGPRQDLVTRKPILRPGYKSYKIWLQKVKNVIEQVQQPFSIRELKGWAHEDHFIRFLYTIRPRNAALIKTLQFWGTVTSHDFHRQKDNCKSCHDSFFRDIFLYIEFINEFCKGVEKIVLNINTNAPWSNSEALSVEEKNTLNPLIPHLKKLKTVKTLVLCISDGTKGSEFITMKSSLAVDTCKWFQDRARGWESKSN